jgi:hypothetical protein
VAAAGVFVGLLRIAATHRRHEVVGEVPHGRGAVELARRTHPDADVDGIEATPADEDGDRVLRPLGASRAGSSMTCRPCSQRSSASGGWIGTGRVRNSMGYRAGGEAIDIDGGCSIAS